jgi:hypothetical protein
MPLHGLGHEFGKQAAALVQILSCLATSSIEGTSRFRSPANYFEKACGSEFRSDPVLRSKHCPTIAGPVVPAAGGQYGESFCRSRSKTRTFRSVHYRGRKAPEGQFAVYAGRDGGFPPFLEELGENRNEHVQFSAVFPARLIYDRIDASNRKQNMPNITKYRVLELRDPREPDLPRFVQAARQGESPWRTLWEHRDKIGTRLTRCFRELSSAGVTPQEVTVLGRAVALPQRTARLLAAFWLEEISRKSGSFPEFPDFIVNERINRGGRGRRRPVVHIDGEGTLTRFESLSAAGRILGLDRSAISRRPGRMTGWADG